MTLQNPTYLVVGVAGVSRLDLFDAIESSRPGAEIIYAKTISEALPLVSHLSFLAAAVVQGCLSDLSHSGLLTVLQRLGSKIVLMGDAAEEAAATLCYPVLERPFGSDDILSALEIDGCDAQ